MSMELSKTGKSVYLKIGFWLEKDGSIHMTGLGEQGFHVAVNADPKKPNGHRTLFPRLAKCLKKMGAPSPKLSKI